MRLIPHVFDCGMVCGIVTGARETRDAAPFLETARVIRRTIERRHLRAAIGRRYVDKSAMVDGVVENQLEAVCEFPRPDAEGGLERPASTVGRDHQAMGRVSPDAADPRRVLVPVAREARGAPA